MKRQAKKGGEIGANGEHYKGGQFIATSEKTIKGSKSSKSTGKKEIANYKWEVAPNEDVRSIWGMINGYVKWDGKPEYSKELGQYGRLIVMEEIIANMYMGNDLEGFINKINDLTNRWMNGERWYQKESWYKG